MRCDCGSSTKCVDSRGRDRGAIRRRYNCSSCGRKFTTIELKVDEPQKGRRPTVTIGEHVGKFVKAGMRTDEIVNAIIDDLHISMDDAKRRLEAAKI